jgi:uncharacterized protein (TIGR00251 family)
MNWPFLKESSSGVYLTIKLQPRASRQQISGLHGSELKVSVTAPPVDAAANRALVEYFAEVLVISRSQIQLVKGQTSRHKTLHITGVPATVIRNKLARYLE